MKHYFFTMTQHHFRDGSVIGRKCGTVTAENEEDATEKALELAGNEGTTFDSIEEYNPDAGYCFTVYKATLR